MEFTVSSDKLYDAMKPLKRVISNDARMAALEQILVQRDEDTGELVMRATDLESHVISRVAVQFEPELTPNGNDGPVQGGMIPGDRFLSTLSALPDTPVQVQIDDDYKIRIETDQGSYEMQGADTMDFPELPEVSEQEQLDAETVMRKLPKVDFAASSDALRPAMMGVLFDPDPKGESDGALVATDGHRLSKIGCDLSTITDELIIDADGVDLIQRIINEDATLSVGEERAWVVVESEKRSVYVRLIDEQFPNYESVIPDDNEKIMRVDTDEMAAAAKRIGLYSSSQTNQIKLSVRPNEVAIEGQDPELSSEAEETLSCTYSEDEEMQIGFNADYLNEVLDHAESEEVVFYLSSPNRAGIIKPENTEENHEMLLMPVMIEHYA